MGKAAYLSSRQWERTRRIVLERDGWRCTNCGKAGRLEVHHLKPLWQFPDEDPFDTAGCAALCRGCHIAVTKQETLEWKAKKALAIKPKFRTFITELSNRK